VTHVILSVGYLREVIYKWIDEVKNEFPFELDYAVEKTPLGTGGGIRLALQQSVANEVIILNGDTFFDVNLIHLMEEHRRMDSSLTVALKPMTEFDRYGAVEYSGDGHIMAFHEKVYCKQGLINGGVYVIDKLKLPMDNQPEKFSFESAVMEKQCQYGNLYGVISNGYFRDIGVPEDYKQANDDFKTMF